MNESKKNILDHIRNGLGRKELPEDLKKSLGEKLAVSAGRIIPERVRLSGPALVREFIRMTEGEATTVFRVKKSENVPGAVATFIRKHALQTSVVVAPAIAEMPWEASGLRTRPDRAKRDDLTSITPAFAGIAETGCFLLLSGPDHPNTLNFLPENHIVVLEKSRIVATPEDAFGRIRKQFGPGEMPRTAVMVAGPSRSADIGTSLQFGAHGPKRLHCILVD